MTFLLCQLDFSCWVIQIFIYVDNCRMWSRSILVIFSALVFQSLFSLWKSHTLRFILSITRSVFRNMYFTNIFLQVVFNFYIIIMRGILHFFYARVGLEKLLYICEGLNKNSSSVLYSLAKANTALVYCLGFFDHSQWSSWYLGVRFFN